MRLPGRVSAAIEVLTEIIGRHRPASETLRDWGKAHRFAGAADRHAIGTLVYDGLRNKRSAANASGSDTPRGIVLGVLKSVWGITASDIVLLATAEHGPGKLSTEEFALLNATAANTELAIAGDLPDWLTPSYQRAFGSKTLAEAQALARRAPIDLRVNGLKADREKVISALSRFGAVAGPLSPWAVRIEAPGPDQKHINVEAEPAHGMGWYEVQDSASQAVALLSGVEPGQSVADICAGAGGKTLALAAMMQAKGKLLAYDRDRHRLRPIFDRITRAGAANVEVISAENKGGLAQAAPFDCVLIDAPCSGSGSWRRKPDAKWRLTRKQLDLRLKEQADVLQSGAGFVRPGGTLVYVTCSVLPEENVEQVTQFLKSNPSFKIIPYTEQWRSAIDNSPPASADGATDTLSLTPSSHETDGFFVAVMRRG